MEKLKSSSATSFAITFAKASVIKESFGDQRKLQGIKGVEKETNNDGGL